MWRRGSSRRCRACRRRNSLWRGSLWRSSLRWLLGFSIGTKFFLGLGHNQWRALRVRRRAYKLQRRQSGGGKQQQTKFCHDGVGPRKILGRKVLVGRKVLAERSRQQGLATRFCTRLVIKVAINEQALGRIVASFQGVFVFISENAKLHCGSVHDAFRGSFKTVLSHCPCDISASPNQSGSMCWHASALHIGRSRREARSLRAAHRQFVRYLARQFLGPRRFARILHRRRDLGAGTSRRAFLRRFHRFSGLDRRILLRIDRHFAPSGRWIWVSRSNGADTAMFRGT
jgi:hypothetical protein